MFSGYVGFFGIVGTAVFPHACIRVYLRAVYNGNDRHVDGYFTTPCGEAHMRIA